MVEVSTVTIIRANAEAFIVPNLASTVGGWSLEEEKTRRMCWLCELNGRQFDVANDKLVELWIHSEDLNSRNLTDHGGYFFEGSRSTVYVTERFVPHSMLLGHKEGDTINIVLPGIVVRKSSGDTDDADEAIINLTVTLKQLGYRYETFGKFEEALAAIL